MSTSKKGFSNMEMQRRLGLKRYEPIRAMVHKLRKAMGQRNDRFYRPKNLICQYPNYLDILIGEKSNK